MAGVGRKKNLFDTMVRQQIVTTVLDLIAQDQPVTMDQIAANCGVAKGTLYNYFKNKRELINYVHQTIIDPKSKENSVIFGSDKSPKAKLHDFIDASFGFQEAYPLYFKFAQSQRTAYEADRERFEIIIQPLVKLCKEGIQKGQFIDLDPFVMAAMIFGTVIGPMQSLEDRQEKNPDLERIKQDIIHLLDRMIINQ
jgi:AcrR family transcriptional regulator